MITVSVYYSSPVQRELCIAGKRKLGFAALALLACVGVIFPSRQVPAQAGALDPTFGQRGIFTASLPPPSTVTSVALQSDGKILAAGQINNLPGMLRLNTNGTLDSSFGTGGVVTTSFNNNAVGRRGDWNRRPIILIGGSDATADNELLFDLARFNTDGSPDTTFGIGGTVVTSPFNQDLFSPTALALQPDGRILLAGTGVIARYDTNGQLDSTFGSGGLAVLASRSVTAMALQANGKILIASGGTPFLLESPSTGAITRYNSNGSPDLSFGGSGQVACLPSGTAMAVQSDGKIVVAGSMTSQLLVPPATNQTGFGLVRFNANGSIDTTFGTRGAVTTPFAAVAPSATATALTVQANGDIVAGGFAGKIGFNGNPEPPSVFALARYSTAGTPDPTFGSGGRVTTAFGSNLASIAAAVVQSDGKIVVVGFGSNSFTVARYLGQ